MKHDLFCPVPDTVHSAHPFHLIGRLERFSYTFLNLHLLGNQFDSIHARLVNFIEMLVQLSGQKQIGIENGAVILQIALSHPTILADAL